MPNIKVKSERRRSNHVGFKARNKWAKRVSVTESPTVIARKKAAQLGCAYAKIYNREQEDIDLMATGLARFKK